MVRMFNTREFDAPLIIARSKLCFCIITIFNYHFQHITVTNTSFVGPKGTRGMNVNGYSHRQNDFLHVVGNTFENTGYYCLYMDNTRTLLLEGNTFTSTSQTAVYMRQTSPDMISIRNNVFQQSLRAMYLDLRSGSVNNDALTIENNLFVGHTDGPVVELRFSSYKATSDIRGNKFENNTGNAATMLYIVNNVGTYVESASVVDNYFDNPSSAYDLKVEIPYSDEHAMYAIRNWWGGNSLMHVQSRIFDHSSDSSKAIVQYEPYRVASDTNTLSEKTSGFFRGNGTIGGVVNEDITLRKGPVVTYNVEEDIVVERGATLTIEAGVVLIFLRGGITVEGRIIQAIRYNLPIIYCISVDAVLVNGRGRN